MRKLLFGLLLTGFVHMAYAQSALKGKVVDTAEKKNLEYAVIALIRSSDSTLYQFSRTDKNGAFQLSGLLPGKYFLLVSYPKFVDFADEIDLSGGETDLGMIPMIQQAALLENVIVRQNIAIRMKGDTIEYKADSFKVAEGASVKDLLRKLPGLQVDKNGQITAQGQKVEKVLVDGEEFFSDDPAVVIENLRADAIDKVQAYDKKSDQAEFTGVDDGVRSKTLNLVLKDDKKKGYMGKIVLGGGSTERYSTEAMLNYFKGKKKFSVYGMANNTARIGLGWDDRSRFGGGLDFGEAEEMGGVIMIGGNEDQDFSDWQNTYYDEGIPRTLRVGAHASNKWNNDKQNANGNYSLRNMKTDAIGNSLRKNILPDSAYYTRENHVSNTAQQEQLFSGIYDVKLDSASSLRFRFNGKLETIDNHTATNTQSENETLEPVNRNARTNSFKSNNQIFLGSVLWRQKFRKKGRTLSLNVSYKNADRNSDGFLFSETVFYDHALPARRDTINQYKINRSQVATANSRLVYTEPAGKKGLIEFNYSFSRIQSTSDRRSFDESNGKYESLNRLFSNRYGLNYLSNGGGLKYQYNSKKIVANLGTNLAVSHYRQKDSLGKEVRHFRYTNLFPTARFTYRFSAQRSLNLNYSGTPQPPGIEQIQPVRENTNPLFITIGNPQLEQAFAHNISLFFSDFKTLTGRNIWINGSFSGIQNAIVNSQVIDSGITRQQFINTAGNFNYWLYTSYGLRLKKAEVQLNFSLNTNGGRYVNFVNHLKNVSTSNTIGLGLYAGKYKEEKYDIGINSEINYNRQASSINKQTVSFWSQTHTLRLNFFVSKQLQLGSEAHIYLREKTDAFTGNNNFTVWDANIDYKFFRKKNGILRLEVKDVLKQRRGYERTFNSNYVFERHYNMLGRYAMLSFIWNFSKNPGETR